jgi:hypothetical protein
MLKVLPGAFKPIPIVEPAGAVWPVSISEACCQLPPFFLNFINTHIASQLLGPEDILQE